MGRFRSRKSGGLGKGEGKGGGGRGEEVESGGITVKGEVTVGRREAVCVMDVTKEVLHRHGFRE